ncbi:F-actin-monooxygenase Mical isoform X2 [Odontomachus brunneus]|uniref:F-actin-monooxygenase Mical isoform X2 n=1 Tax=Odontomachus brunneus TaxID=486640 RepID=UPI0013F1CD07|nr:F-actin-monooxygenase Mical isoform X2 [Odontomachus brunneus]
MDQQQISRRQAANSPEIALANEVFDQFCNATTLKSILGYYRHLCELLKIRPNVINQFYPKLKTKLRSWKAQALWKKFDQRASHKCYSRGKACPNTRILIIGGGPCGLRSAIEAQLLGAKVVVIEKRDRMSRNNVLHLWPFVIQDLRGLGAKKFFGKFCAGSIDHISIRQLQCILLKVALILGIEFHENVSFDSLIQPPNNQEDGKTGWRAKTLPTDHPVSQYEFDVLIGADGKRNTLEGFKRKEFRGKLAIAITANFINKRTEAEARVEEISGVAFIFNQKFFKELYQETGIDLENIVYYKDDTHYFVMTAKKHSLIDKGVILQDHADTAKLLAKENVDREALMLYAREAAEFSTEYQMVDMEFAVNHYGQPDVAMFDFTSMYAAENASRVLERHGYRLLMILVGDSLLEPFWPTGSGCARGFLSSLDAGWAIKGWGASLSPLEVIAERESIYRLLGQTTPENLNRDYAAYTLDPHTRYPNLNVRAVTPIQVRSLLDTDDPESVKQPTIQSEIDIPKKRRRRDLRIDAQTQVHPDTLLRWLQKQVAMYDKIHVEDMGASFKDGLAICAIIHRYRPDLIDFYNLNAEDLVKNNQLAFDTLEKELDIKPVMTGEEMAQCDVPDKLVIFSYLTQIYEAFRGEIPYVKHPKLEQEAEENIMNPKQLNQLMSEQKTMRGRRSSRHTSDNVQSSADKKGDTTSRRSRKRRSTEKMGATMGERQKKINETEEYRTECMKKRQYLRQMAIQQFYKSMRMLQANAKREKNEPFEDYAISLYRQTAPDFKDRVKDLEQKILYPDRETKIHVSYQKGNVDEEFSGRIRNFEDKLKGTALSEKKPKDLLRAIGKIEKTDWNVKEIEKKIEENKMGRSVRHDRIERVPKWSREQFLARQIKMEKRGNDPKDTYSKYADIDNTLKSIGKKIQEGSALGYNKVTAMAEQFSNKNQDAEPKMQKLKIKPTIVLPAQGGSEICHFCNKRVYLMERLSAEGKFFHRGCFRCEYCTISLRIGNHTFDREKNGGRFYCAQHFGLLGTLKTRAEKKKSNLVNKENEPNAAITSRTPEKVKISLEGVAGLDLLDRGQTPERIEFENLAGILDPDEAHSQMDEDEWTDRNFGASTAEMGSSDDISDMSDSDEDNEVFEEAIDQPLTTEGTLELAKNWTLRYTQPHATVGQSDTGSNEYEESSDEYTSEDDESGTATENEEDVRARELRKQEVWLKMPPRNSDTDTGSETEVASSEDTTTEESAENSATEISTDSEFEHDGATPTQHEIPEIAINDSYVRKTRGTYIEAKRIQVKSKVIPLIDDNPKQDQEQQDNDKQLLQSNYIKHESNRKVNCNISVSIPVDTSSPVPLFNPRKGDYLLNRTHSTEGIASRLSLELKKRYLLGGTGLGGSVVKSGSTSNVDTKLRNFTDAISQHQKLLNPAPEPSPTMQAFLQGTSKLRTNDAPLSPLSPTILFSRQLSNDRCRHPSYDVAYKPTTLIETSKAQHLPDLVKESNILKSKTAPNICGESMVNRELFENQMLSHQSNNSMQYNMEKKKSSQNLENIISEENNDFRPRSPLHETSIVVPEVNWSKNDKNKNDSSGDSEIDSDSLSSSDSNEIAENDQHIAVNFSPPRLEIHSIDGNLLLDDGTDQCKVYNPDDSQTFEPDSIEVSFLRDRQLFNRSQSNLYIETLNNSIEKLNLRDNTNKSNCSSSTSEPSTASNKQDDSEENDVTTAVFTETEFSEWARDGEVLVSDDLCDVELNIDPKFITIRKNNLSSFEKLPPTSVKIAEEEDMESDYSKIDRKIGWECPSNSTSKLLTNNENIDYMDTDNESLLDDSLQDASNVAMLRNRGYIEFVNVKTMNIPTVKESNKPVADAPIAKLEPENDLYGEEEEECFKDANVIEINPVTMEDVMDKLSGLMKKSSPVQLETQIETTKKFEDVFKSDTKQEQLVEAFNNKLLQSMEEDSLLLVELAEDTTTSEIVTVLASPVNPEMSIVSGETVEKKEELIKTDCSNPDYMEYVKRLQSRIAEFSNAKDSIDVRKSKRKNSKNVAQACITDMIVEEIKYKKTTTVNDNVNSPTTSRKLEEITRERSKQKNVIQDLLMDKLEAHKQKSAEKKARRAARASSFATVLSQMKPSLSYTISTGNKFVPASIATSLNNKTNMSYEEANKPVSLPTSSHYYGKYNEIEARKEIAISIDQQKQNQSDTIIVKPTTINVENIFQSQIMPLRLSIEQTKKIIEKSKQNDKEWTRVKSDDNLELRTENKIQDIKIRAIRQELSVEDTRKNNASEIRKTRPYSFSTIDNLGLKLQTSKSTDNMKNIASRDNFERQPPVNAKSMDELLNIADSLTLVNNSVTKRDKKKFKDPERRKSIIQAVSDFFFKKESNPLPNQKDKLSMFRLTSKTKEKLDKMVSSRSDTRSKSMSESFLGENFLSDNLPPVPPPPLNYSISTTQVSDDSLSDDDTKTTTLSTSYTQKAIVTEEYNKFHRKSKTSKKVARQAQLKRLRIAQEIQRKLEETEVKQRELENRGVSVEKALRGEGDSSNREEADLLREWFDLMKERTELRRYEKELLVRAQEVQLEDRHERLQQELRERLADDDDKKTSDDVKKEGEILTEMLEIVAKRDSLIVLLEEERQRYKPHTLTRGNMQQRAHTREICCSHSCTTRVQHAYSIDVEQI